MNLEYRLIGSSPAPACYQDLYTAIRWVHAHAADYHIDSNRIYIMGNSSGGHEATLAATLGGRKVPAHGRMGEGRRGHSRCDQRLGRIRFEHPVLGKSMDAHCRRSEHWIHNVIGTAFKEARRVASPIKNIGPNTKPMLLLHSDDDRSVPIQQAIDMDRALSESKLYHKLLSHRTGDIWVLPTKQFTRRWRLSPISRRRVSKADRRGEFQGGIMLRDGRRAGLTLMLTGVATASLFSGKARGQDSYAPPNDLPNPYSAVLNWAQLPDQRKWGSTAGVDIAPNGNIWAMTGVAPTTAPTRLSIRSSSSTKRPANFC